MLPKPAGPSREYFVLLTGEFLYLTFSIKPEYTRLISHFLAGINIRSGHWVHVISGEKSPKTFIGSGAFLVTCVILLFLSLPHFYTLDFLSLIMGSLVLGIFSSLTETLSSNGTDNITVPVALITLLVALEYFI